VPHLPEDYIHRVGRTARVQATGDAYTFVSPEEEGSLRAIERHLGKRLPRHTVAGFDYAKRPAERLEIPLAQRLAALRAQKAGARARARANGERRAAPWIPEGRPGHGAAAPRRRAWTRPAGPQRAG